MQKVYLNTMNIICSICRKDLNFSDENISVLKCGQIFHHDCLQDWIKFSKTCPECRSEIGENSVVNKIYPKNGEGDGSNYTGNSPKSREFFELLAKNNECSQKSVCTRIVELENAKKNVEFELDELKFEVGKLQSNLVVSQSNIRSLNTENSKLKLAVVRLHAKNKNIEKSVDDKVKRAVEPYLQIKKDVFNLTSLVQLPNEKLLKIFSSTS